MNPEDRAFDDDFVRLRPRLLGVAYRMLGTLSDAEDVVQQAWLRATASPASDRVRNPSAYLFTTVSRLCVDRLRSVRHRRESYTGEWLPEPLVTGCETRAAIQVERASEISYASLVLMERLNPLERAVLVLHDAFEYKHAAISEVLGCTSEASRKSLSRARKKLRAASPISSSDTSELPESEQLARRFLRAAREGDIEALVELLHDEVVAVTDGGGEAPAAMNPIIGADRVARLFAGIRHRYTATRVSFVEVNGGPGAVIYRDGGVEVVLCFECQGAQVRAAYAVMAPSKLTGMQVIR